MGKGRRIPSYRHHISGQARVTIRGKDILLGPYDSQQSRDNYARVIAEYLATNCSPSFTKEPEKLCMGDLVGAYLAHAKDYFGDTTEGRNVKRALAPLAKLYMELPASEFCPVHFKTVRADWITPVEDILDPDSEPTKDRSRGYVNGQMARVLRFLKWSVADGKLPSSVYESCRCVDPLKRGKCGLDDTEPIKPVPIETINATLPHMTRVLADMVRFQLLTACRPGELVRLCPSMIDRSSDVWKITLSEHKTATRGKGRTIYVGPKGKKILKPYLFRGPNEPCFSPIESERQRRGKYTKKTRAPRRVPGTEFTTGTFGRAIKNACKRAEVEHWSPNQLRHTAATIIRKQFGLEAAQVILGHSELSVTQVYAEMDQQKAIDVAKKIG